jgi:NAD(P)-dependent dehydrogenase (short-subunit alcohol dehydrogenase family)
VSFLLQAWLSLSARAAEKVRIRIARSLAFDKPRPHDGRSAISDVDAGSPPGGNMKTSLVIGAAGGLGSSVAEALAARGERVLATVLNDAEATAARARVPGLASIDLADLADAEATAASVSKLVERAGSLDAVIVCAAISPYGPMETTPLALARQTIDINCVAALAIYQATLPALRRSGGRIIFVSSMAGRAGIPFIGAYVASKFALEGLADVMRREAKPQGVQIVLVEPGGIRTGMVAAQLNSIGGRIEKLGDEERALYLGLYKMFQGMLAGAEATASAPEAIAAVVIEALDAPKPAARYVAGADAQQLIDLADQLGDAELDEAFAKIFAPVA